MMNDPWDWTTQQRPQQVSNVIAPLGGNQPGAEPIRQVQSQPDPLTSMVQGRVINAGLDKATDGVGTIWNQMANPVAPALNETAAETARLAAQNAIVPAAEVASGAGAATTAAATGAAAAEAGGMGAAMAGLGTIAPYIPLAYMAGRAFKIW